MKAWGRDVRQEKNEYAVNKPPVCFVKFEGIILMVNNVGKPYVTEEYKQQYAFPGVPRETELNGRYGAPRILTVDLMYPKNPEKKRETTLLQENVLTGSRVR